MKFKKIDKSISAVRFSLGLISWIPVDKAYFNWGGGKLLDLTIKLFMFNKERTSCVMSSIETPLNTERMYISSHILC